MPPYFFIKNTLKNDTFYLFELFYIKGDFFLRVCDLTNMYIMCIMEMYVAKYTFSASDTLFYRFISADYTNSKKHFV